MVMFRATYFNINYGSLVWLNLILVDGNAIVRPHNPHSKEMFQFAEVLHLKFAG